MASTGKQIITIFNLKLFRLIVINVVHCHILITLLILGYDCNILPASRNGGDFDKGCPGAVFVNGNPSHAYCTNTASDGHFPWWEGCCEWKEGKCVPKESGNNNLEKVA